MKIQEMYESVNQIFGNMENFPSDCRKQSYKLSKPIFSNQEQIVIDCIKQGYTHAWEISEHTGEYLTSIRRALTCLSDKGKIEPCGKIFHEGSNRWVTKYRIIDDYQNRMIQNYQTKTLFD